MTASERTPLGELFLSADEPLGEPRPGDDEVGRAVLAVWGEQIVARCVDVRSLFERVGTA